MNQQVPAGGVDRVYEECGEFDGPLTTLVAKDQYLMPVNLKSGASTQVHPERTACVRKNPIPKRLGKDKKTKCT